MNKRASGVVVKSLKLVGIAIGVLGLPFMAAERAIAAPVIFGANAYDFVQASSISWFDSDTAAAGSVFMTVNGHLATITSQAENDFLSGLVSSVPTGFNGAWLGGTAGAGFLGGAPGGWLRGPETGSSFTYLNWNTLEPNNAGYLYMSIGSSTPNTGAAGFGKWLDDSGTQGFPSSADPVVGYFIEYEGVAAIPLPAAFPLFGAGLGILGFLGWRRRRQAQAV